jgi:Na+/proline symporter
MVTAVLLIMAAFIGVAVYMGTKVKTLDHYYVAGRNAGVIIVTGTLLASFISTGTMVGQAEMIFQQGPMQWNFIWGAFIGFMVLFFGPGLYMRRKRVRTVSQFLSERFGHNRSIEIVSAVVIIIGMLAFNVSMFLGIGVVFAELFQSSVGVGILLATILTVIIGLIGGQMSVVVTDTIMFVLFALTGILMFPMLSAEIGGWANAVRITDQMHEGFMLTLRGVKPTNWDALIFVLNIGLFSFFAGAGADPRSITRTFIARDEKTVLRTALLGSLFGLIFIFFFQTSIGIVRGLAPQIEPRTAFAYAAMNLVPGWVGIPAMAGLIFAGVSTATTTLTLGSFSIASDIIKDEFFPGMNEKRLMLVTRGSLIVLAIASAVIAYTEPAVLFYITIFGQGLFIATFLPVFILSSYWKGITPAGALSGLIAGVVAYFAVTLLKTAGIGMPLGLHQAHWALAASTIVVLIVSKLTVPSEESLAYFRSLRGVRGVMRDIGTVATFDQSDKRFVTVIIASSIALMALLAYLFYFIPIN